MGLAQIPRAPVEPVYKDFSVQLIPRREGEFTIPGISVSIFDPVRKAYVQKLTEPVRILVNVGHGPQSGGQMMKDGKGGDSGSAAKVDEVPRLLTEYRKPWSMTPAQFAVSFPALLTAMFGLLIFKGRNELGWGEKKKDLLRRLRARLRRVDAKVATGD